MNRKPETFKIAASRTAALLPAATAATDSERWLRAVGFVLAGGAFVALCGHVSLPLFFTPVPLTLQPFAVLLLGLLLSPRLAAATLGAYLAEGALGLPVFAPSAAGFGLVHLLGPTGGYLLAYPAAAALIAFLYRRSARGFASAMLSAAAGDALVLACGLLWFAALTHASFPLALTQTVVPFLPGEALKIAAVAGVAAGATRLRRKRS